MNHPEAVTETPASLSGLRKRRRKLAILTIAVSLLPFVLLEIGLRLAGVAEESVDLHDGFGTKTALFTLNEEQGVWRTSLPREQFFVPQEFTAQKPPNEFRIFCLGGSTVQGRPYEPATSFTKWLELELNAIDPEHQYKTINCGGISYASYRLRPVLKEVLNHQPDLIILATGHNEFLEDQTYASLKSRSGFRMALDNAAGSLRTVMLLRKLTGGAARVEPEQGEDAPSQTVEARLDNDAGYASYHRDEKWRQQVCELYGESVREMLANCAEHSVPVVAVKLGSNLRDCPPFKSEHKADLDPGDEQKWQKLFDQATIAERDDVEKGLALYRQAEQLDNRYPLLHFRIARCLDQLQKYDEAAAAYRRALTEDICPLRMIPAVHESLLAVSEEFGVSVVDAQHAVSQNSPQQIPGYDAYVDHVHPTIGTHQKVAATLVESLIELNLVTPQTRLNNRQRRRIYSIHLASLGNVYFSNGRRRIGWLEGWARRQRLHEETMPIDTRGYIATALRYLDLHDFDLAGDNLQMAVVIDNDAESHLVKAAAGLFAQGRSNAARWIFEQLQIAETSEQTKASIDIATLIMACDSGKEAETREVLSRHENWPEILKRDTSGWTAQIPDVLSQARGLVSELPTTE